MTPDFSRNHFELLGLPVAYAVDAAALDRAYRDLQGQVHPDRFASASEAERRVAMQWATRANEAYRTLRNPIDRARYLLGLKGFLVAIIAGINNARGIVAVGLGYGVFERIVEGVASTAARDVAGFSLMILLLLLYPQGISGKAEVQKV